MQHHKKTKKINSGIKTNTSIDKTDTSIEKTENNDIFLPKNTNFANELGNSVTKIFSGLDIAVKNILNLENQFSFSIKYILLDAAQHFLLQKCLKVIRFQFKAEFHEIDLIPDLGNVSEYTFCVTFLKRQRCFEELKNVSCRLLSNEYIVGINEYTGEIIKTNLIETPNLLISGTAFSGKSTFLHNIISSFVDKKGDDNVAFLLIDTKQVEFARYKAKKYEEHVWKGIAYDIETATKTLVTLSKLIDNRYAKMAENGDLIYKGTKQVLIIDEFADLIMRGNRFIEKALIKIAQLGQAAGVHLILSTQRPSISVCTGLIKANFPCRIAFQCATKADSRVILDQNGAETLRGRGEALFKNPEGNIFRIQCLKA